MFREEDMGTLVFVCPATGREVSTGIEMDSATFEELRGEEVRCLHCEATHRIAEIQAWVSVPVSAPDRERAA